MSVISSQRKIFTQHVQRFASAHALLREIQFHRLHSSQSGYSRTDVLAAEQRPWTRLSCCSSCRRRSTPTRIPDSKRNFISLKLAARPVRVAG